LGGFRSAQGMRSFWHGDRVAKLTSYHPYAKRARWQIESGLASAGPVAPACLPSHGRVRGGFYLHSDHARVDGEPRRGLFNNFVECSAGGCRIVAGDMNMAFWGQSPSWRIEAWSCI
jgi:hypothetical protein